MSDARQWDEWLEELELNGVNLTTWELTFVEQMQARRERGWPLTDKQAEVLERIYTDRTP